MYLVVWLDGQDVRVCRPMLRRLNAALAVLRSHQHEDAPGMVFSGDPERLRAFCDKLDAMTFGTTVPDVLHGIHTVARDCRISVVHPVTAKVTTVPRVGSYPRHITKAGQAVWDGMMQKHQDQIRGYGDKAKQWAAAIILYQRYCQAKGVRPFRDLKTTEQKLREASRDDIRKTIAMGAARAAKVLDDAIEDLGDAVLRLKDEKFYETAKERRAYFITTQYPVVLARNVTPVEALRRLAERGWAGVQGREIHRNVDRHTHLLIEPNGRQLRAYVSSMLTRDELILVFDFPEDVTEQALLRGMEKAGRRWVSSGRLTWTAR